MLLTKSTKNLLHPANLNQISEMTKRKEMTSPIFLSGMYGGDTLKQPKNSLNLGVWRGRLPSGRWLRRRI
jgi:hypothetical protein